jgi:large subunit ribosomal protein L25
LENWLKEKLMEPNTLVGYARTELRKGATKQLRREGKIPAIIYGHSDPVPISVPANEFEKKYHTLSESTIITISVDGKPYDVLIKDYQENTMKGEITHLDFFEIERGKKLRTRVSVHTTGSAHGVKEGGILEMGLHEVDIECLPKDIPSYLEVSIEGMEIGDSIHVSDMAIPEGVEILTAPDMLVVAITTAKVVLEEGAEAEGEELEEGEEGEESGKEDSETEEE